MSVHLHSPRASFLAPTERFSELVFGLVMTLSVTGSLSVAGVVTTRELLVGAVGCNVAWGLVDAVMYLLNQAIERGRARALVRTVTLATEEDGLKAVVAALPEVVAHLLPPDAIKLLRGKIADGQVPGAALFVGMNDFAAALGIFLLVSAGTLPVSLPFLLFDDAHYALRVSNGIALLMLALAGGAIGRYSGLSTVRAGLSMLGVGVVLVAIVIALGG